MAEKIVTFEELDREKRLARARDAERLRSGEITPQALQEENSIFPKDAVITFDFIEYAKRTYLSK
ncbi:MAG: hypothetical protein ABIS50_06280 [Luteolibacter sp.]|uniref:hypothetical protein n=1 Tax=Luteolibacter sp. TaxID=1962973 RepID=UPI0032637CA7